MDFYSSSLEANISGTKNESFTRRGNSPKSIQKSCVPSITSVKSSPNQKSFTQPKISLNPFEEDDYDDSKNPFCTDLEENNTIKDNNGDYDKNLNPFSS